DANGRWPSSASGRRKASTAQTSGPSVSSTRRETTSSWLTLWTAHSVAATVTSECGSRACPPLQTQFKRDRAPQRRLEANGQPTRNLLVKRGAECPTFDGQTGRYQLANQRLSPKAAKPGSVT